MVIRGLYLRRRLFAPVLSHCDVDAIRVIPLEPQVDEVVPVEALAPSLQRIEQRRGLRHRELNAALGGNAKPEFHAGAAPLRVVRVWIREVDTEQTALVAALGGLG